MLRLPTSPDFLWHGALADPELEDSYWRDTWSVWSKVSTYSAWILGIVLIGMVLPQFDLQVLGFGQEFTQLLVIRLGVASLFFGIIVFAATSSEWRDVLHKLTSVAFFATAAMMVVAIRSHSAINYLPVFAHVIFPIAAFVIVPNKPLYKFLNVAVFVTGFVYSLSAEVVLQQAAPLSFLIASYAIMLLVGALGCIRSERISRRQYLARRHEREIREDALAELHMSKLEIQSILENLEDTFFRVDPKGIVTFVTPSVERLLGLPGSEVIGRKVCDFLVDERCLETARAVLIADGGQLRNFRSKLRSDKWEGKWVEASAGLRFDADGTLLGLEGTVRDISDLVKAEEMLRHSQKMEAIGHLTGGMAHDFNNLLAVISGNVELLWGTSKEQRDTVRPILEAIGRGKELTQRLLAFARQQPLSPEPTHISAQVIQTKTLLARTLGAKFEVELAFDDDLWPALVDPGQFENTLINLLLNSRDAMPRGGKILIECRNASLTNLSRPKKTDLKNGDYVLLSVQDNGEGMDNQTIEHAFEPFFSTKETGRGSGLGLSMVYGFARQSGGDVIIDSQIGKGTTLSIYFPRSPIPVTKKPNRSNPVGSNLKGRHILVVEDEPAVREIALRMLAILGHSAVAVHDAAEALDVLTQKNDFDLVLSDVVLPGTMNGPDIDKKLREIGAEKTFVFMSGYLADAIADPTFKDSGTPFLAKPFQLTDLEAALTTALGQERVETKSDRCVTHA